MKRSPSRISLRSPSAFSLVEVTLAIGIVSFGLLAILGLMPVGMTTLRQATEQTIESQIVQKIGGDISQTSYSLLEANFSGKTFYYDDEGRFLTNSPTVAPTATRYWVRPTVVASVYPGSSNAPAATPPSGSISAMRIDIVCGPAEALAARGTNRYAIQIPNSGN